MNKRYDFIANELRTLAELHTTEHKGVLLVDLVTYSVMVEFDGEHYNATAVTIDPSHGISDETELFSYANPVAVAHKILRLWDKDLSWAS